MYIYEYRAVSVSGEVVKTRMNIEAAAEITRAAPGGACHVVQLSYQEEPLWLLALPGRRVEDSVDSAAYAQAVEENFEALVRAWHRSRELNVDEPYDEFLHLAEMGDLDGLRRLVAAGANTGGKTDEGYSEGLGALELAVKENHVLCVEYLASLPGIVAAQGAAALRDAVSRGFVDVARVLLDAGVDVNEVDNSKGWANGWRPLTHAICGGDIETVRLLLSRGASPHHRDKSRSTLLIQAAAQGAASIVALLLASGADPKAKDDEGRTALWYAQENGHHETADCLRKAEE